MIRAGALYFAIVIAFFIAVVSASLIMLAAHYRNSYLKEIRFDRLSNNLTSGIAYVLADTRTVNQQQLIDLFEEETDSVMLIRKNWGIYKLATVKAFFLSDTLKRSFLIGEDTDTTALYLSDEDRPLSISGNTRISGNVFLPKSGIRQSYAEGKPYTGKQLTYNGSIKDSERNLAKFDETLIKELNVQLKQNEHANLPKFDLREMTVSFSDSTQRYYLSKPTKLENIKLEGNIVLYADTTVTISATAKLANIQIYAPYIKVEAGFSGSCQLFASDSVVVGAGSLFEYPSVLGVVRTAHSGTQPKLELGSDVKFNGILFSYEEKRSPLQTFIMLGKSNLIKGEVFSTGLLKLEKGAVVNGKVSCNRFVMKTATTLYENFLIDVTFDRKARSSYYLSSTLFKLKKNNHILKWLN